MSLRETNEACSARCCILTVSLLFKWAMATFQLDINIYCATKLFCPSPMGCLDSSIQISIFIAAPTCFWEHKGWCCAAGIAQQSCAYAGFLILAPWFELSQHENVPCCLPKLFQNSFSNPAPRPLPQSAFTSFVPGCWLSASFHFWLPKALCLSFIGFPAAQLLWSFLATGAAGQILCVLDVSMSSVMLPHSLFNLWLWTRLSECQTEAAGTKNYIWIDLRPEKEEKHPLKRGRIMQTKPTKPFYSSRCILL